MHLTPRRGSDLATQEDPALAEALKEAAGRGKTELVKALCSHGAPVNSKSVSKDVKCIRYFTQPSRFRLIQPT